MPNRRHQPGVNEVVPAMQPENPDLEGRPESNHQFSHRVHNINHANDSRPHPTYEPTPPGLGQFYYEQQNNGSAPAPEAAPEVEDSPMPSVAQTSNPRNNPDLPQRQRNPVQMSRAQANEPFRAIEAPAQNGAAGDNIEHRPRLGANPFRRIAVPRTAKPSSHIPGIRGIATGPMIDALRKS